MSAEIKRQRVLSVASLQQYETAKGKAAAIAAAKDAKATAHFAPKVETAVEIAVAEEHKIEAAASLDSLHRLQAAQAADKTE